MRVKHEKDIVSCLREWGWSGTFMFSGRTHHAPDGKVNKKYTASYVDIGSSAIVGESKINLEDAINNLREKLSNLEPRGD